MHTQGAEHHVTCRLNDKVDLADGADKLLINYNIYPPIRGSLGEAQGVLFQLKYPSKKKQHAIG